MAYRHYLRVTYRGLAEKQELPAGLVDLRDLLGVHHRQRALARTESNGNGTGKTRTTDSILRVGVLGCGYWGSKHVRVLSQLPDVNVEVIDVREDRRDELLQTFPNVSAHSDLDEVLDELDAVVVATPASTHGDLALKAINAGVVVMAGHTFEFNPAVRKLAEIIRQPSFGEVLYLDSLRLNLGLYQPDVNVVCDLAAHDISIFNYLIGREPTSVAAWTARHAKSQGPDDVAYLQFEYDDITANIHVSWLYPAKVRQTTVVGRNQMAVYNDLSDDERVRVYHKGVDHDDDSLHPLGIASATSPAPT